MYPYFPLSLYGKKSCPNKWQPKKNPNKVMKKLVLNDTFCILVSLIDVNIGNLYEV